MAAGKVVSTMRFSIILLILILVSACNQRVSTPPRTLPPADRIDVETFGTEATLDIVSWNIEQFPKSDSTVGNVKEIIRDLDADIYAIQEVRDSDAFFRLLDSLPDYDGRVGFGATNNFPLWPGIIYKKDIVTLQSENYIFTGEFNFPRAPYVVEMLAEKDGRSIDFTMMVLHLKAQGDDTSEDRRRGAIISMEQYISNQIAGGGDPDYILIGDWNDELEDPQNDNVFLPFLNSPSEYTFLTEPFAGSTTEYTFIGGSFRSLIDHIMITNSIDNTYSAHFTQILKIDEVFTNYEPEVSDHRPVAVRIPVF